MRPSDVLMQMVSDGWGTMDAGVRVRVVSVVSGGPGGGSAVVGMRCVVFAAVRTGCAPTALDMRHAMTT